MASEYILNIETSTGVCSVSVCNGKRVLALRENSEGRSHAALLTIFIEEAMKEASVEFRELSAVAVSKGPGSYTGLRIGVSAAKGICYAWDIPLIATETLRSMALRVISFHGSNGVVSRKGLEKIVAATEILPGNELLLCPMIDARRMEVYMAVFDASGEQVTAISAEIIDKNTFSRFGEDKTILIFGDGAGKCRDLPEIQTGNVIFIPGIYPSAEQMAEQAFHALQEKRFEDTAYFEPFYLKDFIATTPKERMKGD